MRPNKSTPGVGPGLWHDVDLALHNLPLLRLELCQAKTSNTHGLGLGLAWLGLGGCATMSTQLDPTGDGP
jgi:hypothetical protein